MNQQANPQATSIEIDVIGLLGEWSTQGHGTLPRRLAHGLRRAVQAGVLPSGTKLPPERLLATRLAVSRATITEALDELRTEGLLASRQGSGTFVAGGGAFAPVGTRVADHLAVRRGIDLATGNPPDLSHLPSVEIDMSLLTAEGGGPGVYVTGLPAMIEAIAQLHTTGGVFGAAHHTEPAQVHITAGAHQGVALLMSTLVGRGGGLAASHHNYPGIYDIADGQEAIVMPVRADRAGMVPEALQAVIINQRPKAIYVQAGPHNPTGAVAPAARIRALAAVADRHELPVIEDLTLAPLAYDGLPLTMLDACRRAPVLSVGSLSKICWAGLRVGWIRGPEPLVAQTMYRRLTLDLGASAPSQLLALGLLPHLETIADERRRRLQTTVDYAIELLGEHLPDVTVDRPGGGSVLWCRLPVDDARDLVVQAARYGVQIAPGSICVPGRVPDPHVRLCVDRPVDLVREGFTRLGQAWRDVRLASTTAVS